MIHAGVDLSGATDDLIELLSIEIDLLALLTWQWSCERRLAQRECGMNSLCEFHWIATYSRTVATKMNTPAMPNAPAITNGVWGVTFQSSPPIAAAGVIAKLRNR